MPGALVADNEDLPDTGLRRFFDLVIDRDHAGLAWLEDRVGLDLGVAAGVAIVILEFADVGVHDRLAVIGAGLDAGQLLQLLQGHGRGFVSGRVFHVQLGSFLEGIAHALVNVEDQDDVLAVGSELDLARHVGVEETKRFVILLHLANVGFDHLGDVFAGKDAEGGFGLDQGHEPAGLAPRIAAELDGAQADLGALGNAKDHLGVQLFVALFEHAGGKGPAVLVEFANNGVAGVFVGVGVERIALADAGDAFQLVVFDMLGAQVFHVLDDGAKVPDVEEDCDLAVGLGARACLDVTVLARGHQDAHVFLNDLGAILAARLGFDRGHHRLFGNELTADNDDVGDGDLGWRRGWRCRLRRDRELSLGPRPVGARQAPSSTAAAPSACQEQRSVARMG